MSIIATDTVTITSKGSLQTDGTYDFSGTTTEARARVRQIEHDMYTATGAVRVHDYELWVSPDVDIANGDRVTFGGVNTLVVKLRTVNDIAGVEHHKKVWVKRFGIGGRGTQ